MDAENLKPRGRHGFASRHEEAAHKQRFASASSHTARLPAGPLRLLQQEMQGSGVSVCANALTRAGLPPAHSPLQGIKHRPNKESVSRLPALRHKAKAPRNNRVRKVPRPAPNSRKLNIALNHAVQRALRGLPPKNFRRLVRLWPTTITWPPQFEVAQNFAQPAENLTAPSGDGAKRSDTSPAPKVTASGWGNLYRVDTETRPDLLEALGELDRAVLGCHCKEGEYCHGDEIATSEARHRDRETSPRTGRVWG